MTELKCPFCQQELDYLAEDIYGNMYCPNCRDKNGFTYKASESIWQELIRTHKALETIRLHLMTAKSRFNLYDEYLVSGMDSPDARFIKEEIEKALEQITALEQKDTKC